MKLIEFTPWQAAVFCQDCTKYDHCKLRKKYKLVITGLYECNIFLNNQRQCRRWLRACRICEKIKTQSYIKKNK